MRISNHFHSLSQKKSLKIIWNENKHFVYIKDFNRFMFNQTKHKNKKHFCMQKELYCNKWRTSY